MQKLINEIARVEKSAGISVRDHLGFGNDPKAILEYFKIQDGRDYIGERNADNKIHGRGIDMYSNGYCYIAHFEKNTLDRGNYVTIHSGGSVDLGACYTKDGRLCFRGTRYNPDGTNKKFD